MSMGHLSTIRAGARWCSVFCFAVIFGLLEPGQHAMAQVIGTAISVDGSLPNSNAMLEVQSPSTGDGKGLLTPRLTEDQRTSASAALAGGLLNDSGHLRGGAAQGLLVYQLDGTQGFYYNRSATPAPAWAYLGNGDFQADGSMPMTGTLNAGGHAITNAAYYGNGAGLAGIPASGITEADPLWAAASNGLTADVSSRLASNAWAAADSTTNYAPRSDWTVTNAGLQAQIDTKGDFKANGSVAMTGRFNMNGNTMTNVEQIAFPTDVSIGDGALAYSTRTGSVAIGRGATACYRTAGVAVGALADGDYNGIAIGYSADGQYSNIAIGFAASAYSGYDRIAIGRDVTNRRNNSVAIRGSLYLDGGTGLLYRSTCGTGGWSVKAFAIDHPLDPENQVLRHYCMEGPEVWNVYAGNARLVNGRAMVALPDYYSALNAPGSEVYALTAVGGRAALWIEQEVKENAFVIGGNADVKVSWEIKVLRNDPACLEDLKQRPVEQMKSELPPEQTRAENRGINTGAGAMK